MAAIGDGPYSAKAIGITLKSTLGGLGKVRAAVIDKGMAQAHEFDRIEFDEPGMAEFIRRQVAVRAADLADDPASH